MADPDPLIHLADAVNTANPLLDSHGIPGHVVVNQHATGLQVQSLAGRRGAKQNLDRFALSEGVFDIFFRRWHPGNAIPDLATPSAVAGHLTAIDLPQLLA